MRTKFHTVFTDEPAAARAIDNSIALLLQDRDQTRKALRAVAGMYRGLGNEREAQRMESIANGERQPEIIPSLARGAVAMDDGLDETPITLASAGHPLPPPPPVIERAREAVETTQLHTANLEEQWQSERADLTERFLRWRTLAWVSWVAFAVIIALAMGKYLPFTG